MVTRGLVGQCTAEWDDCNRDGAMRANKSPSMADETAMPRPFPPCFSPAWLALLFAAVLAFSATAQAQEGRG